MKKNISILIVLIILFTSCQKEVDWNTGGGGGGGTTNQKLVRVGTRSGTDTTTTDYGYNAAGKLIRNYIAGTAQGTTFFIEAKFNRNASNIITSVVLKSDQFAAIGIDSIVTNVKYNTSTSRYTGTVTVLTVFGFTIKDSSVYSYDGSGLLIQEEAFASNPLTGLYAPSTKDVYTYAANGNVLNEKYYDYDAASSSYQLSEEYTNEYDTKVAPLQLGVEAIFLGDMVDAAVNNLTKAIYSDATDPTNNETTDYVYTYNTANKPLTSTSTVTPGGTVTRHTYTYQ